MQQWAAHSHWCVQATDLARQMVTKYGMSDKLGQVSIDYEDDGRSLSSETRSVVESEVCCPPCPPPNCASAHSGRHAASMCCKQCWLASQQPILVSVCAACRAA